MTLAIVLALVAAAGAQDAQYWTMQYGNQARLLGGSVVGGARDVSATYYNPGRLALIEAPEVLLAGNVFEYTTVSIDGALDTGTFNSTRLGSVPSLFAGQIRGISQGKSQWAYSFLGRYNSQFRFDEWKSIDDLLDYPVDQAAGSFSLDETLSEYWAGITWAYPLGERVAIGVTGYVAIRSHRSRALIVAQAARADTAGIALQRRDFDYNHWGALAKIGIGADLGAWQLGLVATTPKLKIFGEGNAAYDESVVGQDLTGTGTAASQILTGFQEGVDATHEAAASVAAGVSRRWGLSTVHLTAEYFAGVARYDALDVAPITSADGSVTVQPDMFDSRKPVFNYGLGVEHRFRENLQGYLSFRTDFTSADEQDDSQLTVSIWDIYHLGAGATFEAMRTDFTIGLIYAFGSREDDPAADLIPDSGDVAAPDQEEGRRVKYRFRRLTGLLGFSFGF